MTTPKRSYRQLTAASIILGAFFLCTTASCNKKQETADWKENQSEQAQTADTATSPETKVEKTNTESASDAKAEAKESDAVRFLSYNLKNYLTMPRYVNNKRQNASKPDDEINALVGMVKKAKPDIIGICEIGSPDDLTDFQNRLKAAGIDLPHKHHLLDFDPVRTLAILSKYPIVSTGKPKELDYKVGDVPFRISRGIIDATIQLPNKKLRVLGVHLKSKRPIPEADQELMRRAESGLLRKHINDILAESPDTHLLVHGDFNDTKRTPTLRTAMGRLNAKSGLIVLHAADSRGHLWTHHWGREDIYSRFDYVMVSKSLDPFIDKENMYLLDDPEWEKASDHRAILVPIR